MSAAEHLEDVSYESGLGSGDSCCPTCLRQVRTWEPSGNDVHALGQSPEFSNVGVQVHVREAIPEHGLGWLPTLAQQDRFDI